jgi:pimeloyl-[acyl-carrier protein] synthase
MDKDVLHQGVFFALQEPKHVANPYPLYHRLRSETPCYWDFVSSAWFVTRYTDVRAGLVDPRLSTKNFPFDVSQLPPDLQESLAPLGRIRSKDVLHTDDADHDRLRRPLNRAFNPAAFERLRPEIAGVADELLAKAERRGSIDLVADYSEPLGNHMFSAMLGLPSGDRTQFIKWCDAIRNFTTMPRMSRATVLKAKSAAKSIEAVRACVRLIISARRENPGDDVIGRSFAVEAGEAAPTEDEVLANCVFVLHSGVRNMSAAITNAFLVLLKHPEQFAGLREHPETIRFAVEELLRYETPLQVVSRGIPEEIEFAGRRIGPGQLLVLLLGAANRDPDQFADPDRLDLMRSPNRHLSFGVGPHGCVGAAMARFGLAIALRAILLRQTRLRLGPGKQQWSLPLIRRTVGALKVFVDRRDHHRRRFGPAVAAPLISSS